MNDLYSTTTLLEAIRTLPIAPTFLRETFFPTTIQSLTLQVAIDKITGNRRVAPFVSPNKEAPMTALVGYQTHVYTPPPVKQKKQLESYDVLTRQPGELPYTFGGATDPVMRAMQVLGNELQDLSDRITRREELMVSSLLNDGTLRIQGEGIDETMDFGMAATHKVTLTGDDLFTSANSNPVLAFAEWQKIIRRDGHKGPANVAILGREVRDAFLAHSKVSANLTSVLGTARVELGTIAPQALLNGVEYLGSLKGVGQLDLYAYDEYYEEENGDLVSIMPADKIYLGNTKARSVFAYGAIRDLKSPNSAQNASRLPTGQVAQTQVYAVNRFAKTWFIEDPSSQILMMQAAPLPILAEPGCYMAIKAV